MRIRHVLRGRCDPHNADGIVRHTYSIAQAQRRLGHDVAVIGLGAHIDQPQVLVRDGLPVHAFPAGRNPFSTPATVRSHVLSDPADIYHIQIPFDPAGFGFGRTLNRHGLPYVLSAHALWAPDALRRHRLKKALYATFFERPLARSALGVQATAVGEADDIRAFAPFARVFVVRSAVNIERIDHQIGPTSVWVDQFGEHGRTYVFLGRLDPNQKGLDILLRAWSQFRATDGTRNARLALIGPHWRHSESELTGLVDALRVGDTVAFPGPMYGGEKYSALAAADVYVQTSRFEGTPYSVQEALACGLPVLVTPGTNFAAAVDQYRAGMSVELDARQVADALRTLDRLSDEQLRTMATQARKLAMDRHSLENIAGRYIEMYRAALGGIPFEDDN